MLSHLFDSESEEETEDDDDFPLSFFPRISLLSSDSESDSEEERFNSSNLDPAPASSLLGFQPETPLIACVGSFPYISIRDVTTLRELTQLPCSTSWSVVEIEPTNDVVRTSNLATYSPSGTIQFFSLESLSETLCIKTVPLLGSALCSITLPSLCRQSVVVAGGRDSSIVYRSSNGTQLCSLPNPLRDARDALWISHQHQQKQERLFLGGSGSGRKRGSVFGYDLERCLCVSEFTEHEECVEDLAFEERRRLMVSTERSCRARVWGIDEQKNVEHLPLRSQGWCSQILPERNLVIFGVANGVEVWDFRKLRDRIRFIEVPEANYLFGMDLLSREDSMFVSVSNFGTVDKWGLLDGGEERTREILGERITDVKVVQRGDSESTLLLGPQEVEARLALMTERSRVRIVMPNRAVVMFGAFAVAVS